MFRLFQDNPDLHQLYRDLVMSGVISAEEFWSNRGNAQVVWKITISVLFRTISVLFRTISVLFRTISVLFRTISVLFRTISVLLEQYQCYLEQYQCYLEQCQCYLEQVNAVKNNPYFWATILFIIWAMKLCTNVALIDWV